MIKKLVFTRGLPGSGKSYYAHELKAKHKDSCFICSTDQYWERPDGVYDFNWELLGQSHKWNQQRVQEILDTEIDTEWDSVVVVDNTNITFSEMKPYIKMALAAGFKIEFVEPSTAWKYDVEECFKRNTHGVPYATILKMNQRWESNEVVMEKLKDLK
jgi:predicted kinase